MFALSDFMIRCGLNNKIPDNFSANFLILYFFHFAVVIANSECKV